MRIGFGYDVHDLVEKRDLVLGGVKIDHKKGLMGHSDADVLIHAIMDAILGAMAEKDIGNLFPDTDEKYENIDSRILLRKVYEYMDRKGYRIGNIDSTIVAQKPKLAGFIDAMRENISSDLKTDIKNVSVKATTTERLGFVGREEGMEAYCLLILENK